MVGYVNKIPIASLLCRWVTLWVRAQMNICRGKAEVLVLECSGSVFPMCEWHQCCSSQWRWFCSDSSALSLLLLSKARGTALLSHQGCPAAPSVSLWCTHCLISSCIQEMDGKRVCLNGFLCTPWSKARRNTSNRLACSPRLLKL